MRVVEVNTPGLVREFLALNALMNQDNPNYIRPLDNEVEQVFDPHKNKLFKDGDAKRWIIQNNAGETIGRIAAFYYSKYKNKGTDFPVGCVGYFDCINDQAVANLLFDTAKHWLAENGMEAMDGPINFGDRDKWWGLMVEGFDKEPMYGMSFNPNYYEQLFVNYGFENFYNQYYYKLNIFDELPSRFKERYEKFNAKSDYHAKHLDKNNLEKFAQDFVTIYNAAWAQHGEAKAITLEQIMKLFKTLKPIMDPKVIWFAYYKEDPIAMFINIPDVNQYFKYFDGKLGLKQKLHLLWMKWRGKNNRLTGLAFGVVPKYQSLGIDSFLIYSSALVIWQMNTYHEYEMGWAADWNPKMVNIYKSLGAKPSRHMVTYRHIFNPQLHPFERHPIMEYSTASQAV
jgi:GNAT superfamily N-acetyltransferase